MVLALTVATGLVFPNADWVTRIAWAGAGFAAIALLGRALAPPADA